MTLRTLGTILVALLAGSLLVFAVALRLFEEKFDVALQSIDATYNESVLPLRQIDANTKNIRFHLYAIFMHDRRLDVSTLHQHPITFHFATIASEVASNERLWRALVARADDADILALKARYDAFYRDGITPALQAAQGGRWSGIVSPITATLPGYQAFEDVLRDKIDSTLRAEHRRYARIRAWQDRLFLLLLVLVPLVLTAAIALSWRTISRHSAVLEGVNGALERANETLEETVAQRTGALALANEEQARLLDDLRRTQRKLVQAEKLSALNRVVTGVAHELNTPIGNCLVAATTLPELVRDMKAAADKGVARSTFAAYVEQIMACCQLIERSLRRAADIISTFKFLGTDQHRESRQRFELAHLLRAVVASRAGQLSAAGCSVELRATPALELDSYPDCVATVVNVLIDNTLAHATTAGVTCRIAIDVHQQDQQIHLSFSDDGRGMTAEVLQRIFDPFFSTTMGQGTGGLGMTVAYNIVTGMLDGHIAVNAAINEGTQVEITMPRSVGDGREA